MKISGQDFRLVMDDITAYYSAVSDNQTTEISMGDVVFNLLSRFDDVYDLDASQGLRNNVNYSQNLSSVTFRIVELIERNFGSEDAFQTLYKVMDEDLSRKGAHVEFTSPFASHKDTNKQSSAKEHTDQPNSNRPSSKLNL